LYRFKLTYTKQEPSAQGSVSAELEVYSYVTLSAGAKLFDNKYEAGVAIIAPKFTGKFETTVNTNGGVCNNPALKLGVNVSLTVAAEAFAYLGKSYLSPSKSFPAFKESAPFLEKCIARR
jgi:hypothetical protein